MEPGHAGWAWIGSVLARPQNAAKRSNSPPGQHGADHRFVELWPWQHGDAVLELLHSLGAGEYEEVLAPAGTGDLPVQLLTAARSRPVIAISPSNHAGPSSETCSASIR